MKFELSSQNALNLDKSTFCHFVNIEKILYLSQALNAGQRARLDQPCSYTRYCGRTLAICIFGIMGKTLTFSNIFVVTEDIFFLKF